MTTFKSFAWVPVALLLMAGTCGPTTPPEPVTPGPGDGCTLSCPFGRKATLDGTLLCECRAGDCTANEPPAARVDPTTGACVGFPTDCDSPSDWAFCPACGPQACGPAPGGREICPDGSIGGVLGCSRTELGTCEWSVFPCPLE